LLDATLCRWCGAQAAMILARSLEHKQPLNIHKGIRRKDRRVKPLAPTKPSVQDVQTFGDEHVRQPSGQIAVGKNEISQQ
jgi:hypothetical protein